MALRSTGRNIRGASTLRPGFKARWQRVDDYRAGTMLGEARYAG